MITIKTPEDIKKLREGGRRLAEILHAVSLEAKPGVMTDYLDVKAFDLIKAGGDKSAFLNYRPKGAARKYPASLCVSINEEVVHGIPNEYPRALKEGDIVSLDLGLIHDGLYTDHAITVAVGAVSGKARELMDVTKKAMMLGIAQARAGKKTGDIGYAIESCALKHKLGIVEELTGHGVGYAVHEDPFVPNFGAQNEGALLKAGMVIAIEPMFTLGAPDVELLSDEWTYATVDKSLAAHFEHTVVITDGDPEILTKI